MAGKDGGKCSADVLEGSYFMARLMVVIGLMASVLALSGLFHSGLRRLGQPSIISHILAGVVVGPTVLGRMVNLRQLGMEDTGMALDDAIYYLRVVFMFFTGLEMDLCYLRRYLRASLVLASGGSALCLLLAAVAGPFFYGLLHPGKETFYTDGIYASTALFMLVLTSTASPVLIRIVTELKLTGSETGQLAIGTAFANDIASLVAVSIMDVDWTTYDKDGKARPDNLLGQPMAKLIIFLFLSLNVWIAIRVVVWLVRLLNRAKKGRQYISMYVLCAMLLFIVNTAQRLYVFGYSASMTAFLIGLATPRDGPTARTLIDQLTYPVHQIIMPLCFGVTGARLDFTKIGDFTPTHLIIVVAFTTLLGTTGRVAGTVAAGRMIGIPAQETLVLGLLLNVKGYADILAINLGDKAGIWGDAAQSVLLLSSIINTLMAGPASAAIVRQQRRAFQYRSHCLQDLKLDEELRVLVCVHGAGSVHAMLTLAEISNGTTPVAIYLLHLIELMTAHKYAITHLYHPKGGARDDNGRWGHTREIDQVVAAVDRFTNDTIVAVRQMTAISNLASMDTDVCNGVEDTRASLVIVPFHKEQRYDRRMVCRREGRRELNQRILQRAPCTVGVLVERRLGSIGERQSTAEGNQSGSVGPEAEGSAPAHDVVAVFLGGSDDREAVAYATRLAAHPSVSVTVSRFLPEGASMDATTLMSTNDSGGDGDHVTVMVEGMADEEGVADEEFMAEFYARFVEPGHVSYTERYVRNGVGVVESLWSMVGMYSLFIVGKGGGGGGAAAEMTKGMGGLNEECPELGPIGDFLSSDDLLGYGASVLVLRHHNVQKKTRGTQ